MKIPQQTREELWQYFKLENKFSKEPLEEVVLKARFDSALIEIEKSFIQKLNETSSDSSSQVPS